MREITAESSIADTETASGTEINPNSALALLKSSSTQQTALPITPPFIRSEDDIFPTHPTDRQEESRQNATASISEVFGLCGAVNSALPKETAVIYTASRAVIKNIGVQI